METAMPYITEEPVTLICWHCKKPIRCGDLHVFSFARRHRHEFVPKGRRGIFHLCGRCCDRVPHSARRVRWNDVHIHAAIASSSTHDGYEGRYSRKDVHVGKRLFSITLSAAERYLNVTAQRCRDTFKNK